jgi:predicted nucleotidyltransferase
MRGTSEPPKGNPRPLGRGGGQIEVAREVKELIDREVKVRVFVFGSTVRGYYCTGLSDIDVAIVSSDFENREKKLRVYSLL